jgi:rRNA maturation RNase YbeY
MKEKLRKALEDLDCHDGELSILLTDDLHIADLNRNYLGRSGPTNVLAFPMSGGPSPDIASGMLGDVVVSVDTARKESRETGESLEVAVYRLLLHGLLHLLGYDHEKSPRQALLMERKQERLLEIIKNRF